MTPAATVVPASFATLTPVDTELKVYDCLALSAVKLAVSFTALLRAFTYPHVAPAATAVPAVAQAPATALISFPICLEV